MSNVVFDKIKAGARIIDVRTFDEYMDGAYPGAVNIPVGELVERLSEIPKHTSVIVYCASGGRSAMAARMMKQAGYVDVINAGGLDDMPQ